MMNNKFFQKLSSFPFQKDINIKKEVLKRYLQVNVIDEYIHIEKNNVKEKWSVEKFEKEMEVQYLPNLCFENEMDLRWVIKKCEKALKDGFINEKQRWLGIFFEKEMQNGKMDQTYLKWINPVMEWGLFARKDIEPYTYIGEYTGFVRKYRKIIDDHNAYCFEYSIGGNIHTHLTIDAKEKGNLARFINHSFSPNLNQTPAFQDGVMHVVFRANRKIKKGEQLTYNYGKPYWKKREKPL